MAEPRPAATVAGVTGLLLTAALLAIGTAVVLPFEMDTTIGLSRNRLAATHYGFYNTVCGVGWGSGSWPAPRASHRSCGLYWCCSGRLCGGPRGAEPPRSPILASVAAARARTTRPTGRSVLVGPRRNDRLQPGFEADTTGVYLVPQDASVIGWGFEDTTDLSGTVDFTTVDFTTVRFDA